MINAMNHKSVDHDQEMGSTRRYAKNGKTLFKHVVQYDHTIQDGKRRPRRLRCGYLTVLKGKNFADIARGLRDITGLYCMISPWEISYPYLPA